MKTKRIRLAFGILIAGLLIAVPDEAQVTTTMIPNGTTPLQGTSSYAAKFICDVQPDRDITHMVDAQAGRYSTKINVHNNTGQISTVRLTKTATSTTYCMGRVCAQFEVVPI
jgi:hypothetical protein